MGVSMLTVKMLYLFGYLYYGKYTFETEISQQQYKNIKVNVWCDNCIVISSAAILPSCFFVSSQDQGFKLSSQSSHG